MGGRRRVNKKGAKSIMLKLPETALLLARLFRIRQNKAVDAITARVENAPSNTLLDCLHCFASISTPCPKCLFTFGREGLKNMA